MIVMQVKGVRLKKTAGDTLSHKAYQSAVGWLERVNWQSALEAVIAGSERECEEMLKEDLAKIISYAFMGETVKPEHFEFEVSSQEVNNGRFWMPSCTVWCNWISVKD